MSIWIIERKTVKSFTGWIPIMIMKSKKSATQLAKNWTCDSTMYRAVEYIRRENDENK